MKSRDTSTNAASSKTIVCVHTPNDESFYHDLQTYLSLWERERSIQWLETPVGSDVEQTMQAHLRHADLILLLISPDFFAQDKCHTAMKTALQEQARRQVPVVPVLARTSIWKGSPCGRLHALPDNEQPIAEWSHPEQAYEDICSGLVRLLLGDDNYPEKPMQKTARPPASATPPLAEEPRTRDPQPSFSMQNIYGGAQGIFNAPVHISSNVPRLLPCGHQQHDLQARFCGVCGRPVS